MSVVIPARPAAPPHCRFYGMAYTYHFGIIESPGSNQCGLFTTSITPCRMEACHLIPEERICPYIAEIGEALHKSGGGMPLTMIQSANAIMSRLESPGIRVAPPLPTPTPTPTPASEPESKPPAPVKPHRPRR